MKLSQIGMIVENCWRRIPEHFPNVKLGIFQVMPNHIHGIIEIRERPRSHRGDFVGVEYIQPLLNEESRRGLQLKTPTRKHLSEVSPKRGSLGVVIRTFKGAVISELRKRGRSSGTSIWQRSFHDHIIRDDIDRFFIEQYIELNPLMWYLDQENPDADLVSDDELRNLLRQNHRLDGQAIDRVIDYRLLRT